MRIIAALLAIAAAPAGAGDASPGHLVLIGGGERPREVMLKFVELAGGPAAPLLIVPTASAEPDTGPRYLKEFAEEYGCTNVQLLDIKDRADAQRPELVALVDQAAGVFFSGGDQRRITAALLDTSVGQAISRLFARGGVVGGTSAGTACISPLMITGEGDFTAISAANVEVTKGLGFFAGAIVDQHFIARQRQNRLFSVVLEHPELVGVGVDEATAVWVRPNGTFQVLGNGTVMVIDARAASITRRPRPGRPHDLLGATGIEVHLLLPGQTFTVKPWTRDAVE